MKTLLLILSLFLVTTDQREVLEHGVSSVTSSGIVFHIGHQWFVDDDLDGNDVPAPGHRLVFPSQPPALFFTPSPLRSEPRPPLLGGNSIRAPPLVLA